jgi:uncharacterized membrane protein YciS (DUF1049 family)
VIRLACIVVVIVAVLVVASENRGDLVMVKLLFGFRTPPLSVAVLVLASFGAGAAAVALLVVPAWIRASLRARRQRREIETLEGQVATAGAPPAVEPSTGGVPPRDVV